jgi:hypothetical protein
MHRWTLRQSQAIAKSNGKEGVFLFRAIAFYGG